MSEQPLVSVVMPAFNSAEYIAEALSSAVNQDYPEIEVIVVDDGSSDDTAAIVARFGAPVRLLTQANQGSAVARNLGIRDARGKYVAFLDADDFWWPHKIRTQVEALRGSSHRMAYSRFIWWEPDADGKFPDATSQFLVDDHPRRSDSAMVTGSPYVELLLDCIVWTSTVIVEKAALEQVGPFDTALRKGQDYDMWLRLSRQVSMLGLEQATALYRIHGTSITQRVPPLNYEYRILSNAIRLWGETGPDGRRAAARDVSERLRRSTFNYGMAHLRRGDPGVAARSFMQSMHHGGPGPSSIRYLLAALAKQGWLASAGRWLRRSGAGR